MGSSTDKNTVTELLSGRRKVASFLRRRRGSVASALGFTSGVVGILTFAAVVPVDAKAEATLDQCANLDTVCDAAHPEQWQHGNLTHNDASYHEGASVPYRAVLSDLTVGTTYAVTIEWDTTHSGKHALDYLTSFDRSVPGADPCAGYTCGAVTQLAIPVDPNVAAAGVTEVAGRFFTAYGATFPAAGSAVANSGNLCGTSTCLIAANPSAHVRTGSYAASSRTSITVHVTAASDRVVLAWGGHIAERKDWGTESAADASSGPQYHMRLIDLTCSDSASCEAGNQDRALSSLAVVYPASQTIVKESSVGSTTSTSTTSTSTTSTSTTSTSTTSTSVAGATTTVPTTTVAPQFQALLTPSQTVPAESDFLVLYPDELPNTGGGVNWAFIAIAFVLLVMGGLIGFFNLRSPSAQSNTRSRKD